MIPVNEAQQQLQDLIVTTQACPVPSETLYLLSILGMWESIRKGLATSI